MYLEEMDADVHPEEELPEAPEGEERYEGLAAMGITVNRH